jgi:pilus assembly protein Flp/PilA
MASAATADTRGFFGPLMLIEGYSMRLFRFLLKNNSGATAVEYGLIIGIISLSMIAGFTTFTDALTNTFKTISNSVDDPVP